MKKKQAKETLEKMAHEPKHFIAGSDGRPIEVTKVIWNEFTRVVETPTWHIHMTWLILCVVSAALGFYYGYPFWTK